MNPQEQSSSQGLSVILTQVGIQQMGAGIVDGRLFSKKAELLN